MPASAVAANVLGTMGAVCWSIQLLPQIYKSYKRKDTAGLSSWMLGIWFVGGIFLGAYVIVENINIPLIVQPQCFCLLAAVSWSQCLYYDQGRSRRLSFGLGGAACVVGAGLEAALIFGAKAAEKNGHNQVTKMTGIVSATMIVLGLVPQYIEIYRFKAVVGISLVFLSVDLMGGIFSFLSLVFTAGPFDIIASISYGAVAVLEVGVFVLYAILNPLHVKRLAAQRFADEEVLAGRSQSPVRLSADSIKLSSPPPAVAEFRGSTRRVADGLGWLDPAGEPDQRSAAVPVLARLHSRGR